MNRIKELKAPLRAFLQQHYSDEKLAMLLAHAKDGKLQFATCCCFIGVATADHSLDWSGNKHDDVDPGHYCRAQRLPAAHEAEMAYWDLGRGVGFGDDHRRRFIIPLIKAEMKRREWLRKKIEHQEEKELVAK